MRDNFNSVVEFGGPLLVDIWIGYWVYVRVEEHAYAKVAGLVAFLLFCETDRIRRLIEVRMQALSTSLGKTPRKLSPECRQGCRVRKLYRKGSNRRFRPLRFRKRRHEAHE